MDDEEQFMAVAVDGGAPSRSASITQPIQSLVSLPINSQWQRGNLVGRGSFGSVYIATNSKLKHPNIVQYYDSEIVDNWFRIYMEYVPGGSIKKYIKDNGAIPESDVCWFTTHILSGLEYLHSENIVHRDIKGDNLLIDSSGVVRLADFGTAKRLVHGLEPSSPDAVLAVDIWSVGCTFLEMLTGRLPWGDLEPKEVVAKMGKGKPKADGNEVRIGWKDPRELKAYCDLCATQVLDGKKHDGFLRKERIDEVIEQLGEMGKVVTPTQFKNKWDHLRKCWKAWKECFAETGLGYDPVTGVIHMTDEWWTRKIQACPKVATYKNKPLPNMKSMEIMFEGTVATGKHAFCTTGEIPNDCTKGSRDSADSKEFVDPQCEPSANSVDPTEVKGSASSKARPAVNKGKGLASGVQLFRGICKKPRKKRSTMQELFDSLKSMSDVIVESRSVSMHNTPFRTTAANEMQAIMDMVVTLPGCKRVIVFICLAPSSS